MGHMDQPGHIRLHPDDNVVVLTGAAAAGTKVLGEGAVLERMVIGGHKIAARPVAAGEQVIKYGQIIGNASVDIETGEHVHSHNCAMGAHDQVYVFGNADPVRPAGEAETFSGIRRADGGAGTRNFIALCSTVNCSATAVRKIADRINHSGVLDDYPNVDGVVALAHGTGCGMAPDGDGFDNLDRALWGFATHPNVGAAIFVGAWLRGHADRQAAGTARGRGTASIR